MDSKGLVPYAVSLLEQHIVQSDGAAPISTFVVYIKWRQNKKRVQPTTIS